MQPATFLALALLIGVPLSIFAVMYAMHRRTYWPYCGPLGYSLLMQGALVLLYGQDFDLGAAVIVGVGLLGLSVLTVKLEITRTRRQAGKRDSAGRGGEV